MNWAKNKIHQNWKLIPILLFSVFLFIYIILDLAGILTLSQVKILLQGFGPSAGLIIIGLLAVDIILPVPSSVVMTFSGSLYGVIAGAFFASIGSLTGSLIGFIIFRKTKQKWTRVFLNPGEKQSMNQWFTRWGEGILILSRMIPMVTETMSCFAGVTDISGKRFFAFIVIGTIPVSLYYAYVGATVSEVSAWPLPLAIGLFIPGVIWIVLRHYMKSSKNNWND